MKTPKQIKEKIDNVLNLQIQSRIRADKLFNEYYYEEWNEQIEKIASLRGEVEALKWVLGEKIYKLYG